MCLAFVYVDKEISAVYDQIEIVVLTMGAAHLPPIIHSTLWPWFMKMMRVNKGSPGQCGEVQVVSVWVVEDLMTSIRLSDLA